MIKRDYLFISILLGSNLLLASTSYSQQEAFSYLTANNSNSASTKIIQNTLANNPKSKTAKLCCAKVYLKNGDYKEAEELIMQVLEEDPSHKKANQLLKELNKSYTKHIENNTTNITTIEEAPKQENFLVQYNDPKPVSASNPITTIETKIQEPPKIKIETKPNNNKSVKLPTKEEILKKAKEKKQSKEKNIVSSNTKPVEKTESFTQPVVATPLANSNVYDKNDFIEPIIIDKPLDAPSEEEVDSEKKK